MASGGLVLRKETRPPPGGRNFAIAVGQVARRQQDRNGSPEKSRVVLIVDADELLRWSLREVLESEGFQVHEVGTAEATGSWIEAHETPAVALLDPELPDASGLEVLQALKSLAPTCQIVMMTAEGTTQAESDSTGAGASGFIAKPFDLGRVVAQVRMLAGLGPEP